MSLTELVVDADEDVSLMEGSYFLFFSSGVQQSFDCLLWDRGDRWLSSFCTASFVWISFSTFLWTDSMNPKVIAASLLVYENYLSTP